MEKYKKLNIIAASFILLSLIIFLFVIKDSVFKPVSELPFSENLWIFLFFISPILYIVSLILSIISVIMKRNWVGFIIMVVTILTFVPVNFMQIFIVACAITGYRG